VSATLTDTQQSSMEDIAFASQSTTAPLRGISVEEHRIPNNGSGRNTAGSWQANLESRNRASDKPAMMESVAAPIVGHRKRGVDGLDLVDGATSKPKRGRKPKAR
jgi:hypothetical protein